MNNYKQLVQKIIKNKYSYGYNSKSQLITISSRTSDMICFDYESGEVYCVNRKDFIQYASLYFVIRSTPLDSYIQYDLFSNELWFVPIQKIELKTLLDIGMRLGILYYLKTLSIDPNYNSIDFMYIYRTTVSYCSQVLETKFQYKIDCVKNAFPLYCPIIKMNLISWAEETTLGYMLHTFFTQSIKCYIKGVRDPITKIKTYHGLIANGELATN